MGQKIASPAKWTELFSKAVREAVAVRQLGRGQWIATSGTDTRKAYAVTLSGCECPGHEYHGYCKHRALLAWTLGVLCFGAPEPQPPAPAVPAVAGTARRRFGLSPEELVLLRGQAARLHAEHGEPLVDVESGELLAA